MFFKVSHHVRFLEACYNSIYFLKGFPTEQPLYDKQPFEKTYHLIAQ